MFVNVAFGALGVSEKTSRTVPKDAVQMIGTQQFVFLATDKLRPVRLGPETNGLYAVLEGLNTGDRIISSGSFLLRAEWVKQHPAP